jgi:hypothetical protein
MSGYDARRLAAQHEGELGLLITVRLPSAWSRNEVVTPGWQAPVVFVGSQKLRLVRGSMWFPCAPGSYQIDVRCGVPSQVLLSLRVEVDDRPVAVVVQPALALGAATEAHIWTEPV